MQAGNRAVSGRVPGSSARRRMLSRALVVSGFAVAGSVLLGVGSASADEADGGGLDGAGALVSILTDSATDPVGSLATLGDSLTPINAAVGTVVEPAIAPAADLTALAMAPAIEPIETESAGVESAAAEPASIEPASFEPANAEPTEAVPAADRMAPAVRTLAAAAAPAVAVVDPVLATAVSTSAPATDLLLDPIRPTLTPLAPVTSLTTIVVDLIDPVLVAAAPLTGILAPVTDQLGATTATLTRLESSLTSWGELAIARPATAGTATDDVDTTEQLLAAEVPGAVATSTGGLRAAHTDTLVPADRSPSNTADGSGEGHRPNSMPSPLAGLPGLLMGAPGAAGSADLTGAMTHALPPEEAVQRARLFSAAAYARGIDGRSQREANSPPVSPD